MDYPTDAQLLDMGVQSAAHKAQIPAELLDALVRIESSRNPNAVSRAGAVGLTQLMPAAAQEVGVTDRFDPRQNLHGGAEYLRRLLERFGGDPHTALRAYNAGPTAVARGSPGGQEYADKVQKMQAQLQAQKEQQMLEQQFAQRLEQRLNPRIGTPEDTDQRAAIMAQMQRRYPGMRR